MSASRDNKVYAFNASTGAFVWSAATAGGVFSSPTVVGNSPLYRFRGRQVACLRRHHRRCSLEQIYSEQQLRKAPPAVASGIRVCRVLPTAAYYALNAATGAVIWTVATGQWRLIPRQPSRIGAVYFADPMIRQGLRGRRQHRPQRSGPTRQAMSSARLPGGLSTTRSFIGSRRWKSLCAGCRPPALFEMVKARLYDKRRPQFPLAIANAVGYIGGQPQ